MLPLIGGVVGAGLLLLSPAGRVLDQELTTHFQALNQRRASQNLSWFDGMECHLLYTSIALGGRLLAPEGGKVLWHYLHGRGKDLRLSPEYIKTSPVVRRSLALLREGKSQRFAFPQLTDARLGYAINPFNLRKQNGVVLLWQRIDFKTDPTTYTTLDYGLGRFRLPDALVHALHPQPYTVYAQWNEPLDR